MVNLQFKGDRTERIRKVEWFYSLVVGMTKTASNVTHLFDTTKVSTERYFVNPLKLNHIYDTVELMQDYVNYYGMMCNLELVTEADVEEEVVEKIQVYPEHINQCCHLVENSADREDKVPVLDVLDNSKVFLGPEVVQLIEEQEEAFRMMPETIDLHEKGRVDPASAKMLELMTEIPEIKKASTYLEIGGGHGSFAKQFVTNSIDPKEVTLTFNINDPSYTPNIDLFKSTLPQARKVKFNAINSNANIDQPGHLKSLIKTIRGGRKDPQRYDMVVLDIPATRLSDTNHVASLKKNGFLGMNVDPIPSIMGRKELRTFTNVRMFQARYICRSMLSVGGILVLKLQHLETLLGIMGLQQLMLMFRESKLCRLKNSKGTGTEVYFVGIGYCLSSDHGMIDEYEIDRLLNSVCTQSLHNFFYLLKIRIKEEEEKKTMPRAKIKIENKLANTKE